MWLDAPPSMFQKSATTRLPGSHHSFIEIAAGRNDAERRATLLRVRYCGLFATDGCAAKLEHCRTLIDAAAADAPSQEFNDEPELLRSADEEADDEDEGIVPSGCVCRSCHAELEVTGRLKGTPTLELLAAWSRLVTSTASYGMGSALGSTRTRALCAHQPHVATVEFG